MNNATQLKKNLNAQASLYEHYFITTKLSKPQKISRGYSRRVASGEFRGHSQKKGKGMRRRLLSQHRPWAL